MFSSVLRVESLALIGAAVFGVACQEHPAGPSTAGQVQLELVACGTTANEIKGCVAKTGGALRVIGPRATCFGTETTLCWSQTGPRGSNSITAVTLVAEGDATCPTGGSLLSVGTDHDADGVLDANEFSGSTTVCNGEIGPAGPQGPAGQDGSSCTVVDNGDGTQTIGCEDGTVVTVSDGANGADGESVVVNVEPAGANCANGGVRIESASGVNYVCDGDNGVLVEPGTCGLPAGGGTPIYVTFSGGLAGIDGAAPSPAPARALAASATCHGLEVPLSTSGAAVGVPVGEPFVILTSLGKATPSLFQALTQSSSGDVTIQYFKDGAEDRRTTLHTARVASVEQITLPDPANPGHYAPVQRVAFVYQSLTHTAANVESNISGLSISTSVPPADECLSTLEESRQVYLSLRDSGNRLIRGDVTTPTAEAGSIRVYDACHAAGAAYTSTGVSRVGISSLVVVKRVDATTNLLYSAFDQAERLTGTVHYYAPGGGYVSYEMDLNNVRVESISEYVEADGTRYERLSLAFATASLTYTPAGGGSIATQLDRTGGR